VAWTLLAGSVACTGFTSGDDPIAIELVAPPDSLRPGETLFVHVRVLNAAGDTIPGAPITLTSLTPDTIGIDSARQAVFVQAGITGPGSGRIVARSGDLLGDPFRIIVPAP
jgi:hypothetical protein